MSTYELPTMNHIDLKITYACNYKCEYCYQRAADGSRSHHFLSKENAENFVEFCRKLGDSYHITLAGGEPFVYPYLQYLGEELTSMGNIVNLITNFSVDFDKIKKFIDGCHNRLEWFSISVHLSQWENIDDFYEKLNKLVQYKNDGGKTFNIVLTCVVTNENFRDVLELDKRIQEMFPSIELQLQRVKYGNRYEIYTDEIEEFLKKKGMNMTVKKEEANQIDFYGRECWAGSRFFYIESNGDVRRCYTKQKNDAIFNLGNLRELDKIHFSQVPVPCLSCSGGCICHPHFVNSKFITSEYASEEDIRTAININW